MKRFLLIVLAVLIVTQWLVILPAPVLAQEPEKKTLDVIIIMDTSKSNVSTDPDNLRQYVTKALFDLFLADTDFTPIRVGVIFFGTEASLWENRLFDSTDKKLASLTFPSAEGLTVIDKPFQLAYETFDKYGTYENKNPSAVIFLTDGRPEDDDKPGSQDTERKRLFAASRPWVEKFAQNGTRLYMITYGNAVLQEPEWQEFADLTRGDYRPVSSLQEATDIYVQLVAQALLGYNPQKILDAVKMQPFQTRTEEITVYPATNRLIFFAIRYDPATEITLKDPSGNLVKETADNVLVRGGEPDSRDKVWRIDYPEPGKWTIQFKGGISNIESWFFFRPYSIDRIYPNETNAINPGDPLIAKVRLKDLHDRKYVTGELTSDLKMSAQVTDPKNGETSSAIPMRYDPITGEFTLVYDETVEGRYVVQYILTVAQDSFTLTKEIDNIIIGFRPILGDALVESTLPNDISGWQQDEPLKLKFQVDGLNYVEAPGFINFNMSLRKDSGDSQLLSQDTLNKPEDGKFELDLPHPLEPGHYEISINLKGQTKQGVDFGLDNTGIGKSVGFDVAPYAAPKLTSFSINEPVYWLGTLKVWFTLRTYNPADQPSFLITVYEEGKTDPVESVRLSFQNANKVETTLLYFWESSSFAKPGNYRVEIASADQGNLKDETNFSVGFSTTQTLFMGLGVLCILLAAVLLGISIYINGYKVIGTLEYLKPDPSKKPISLSGWNAHRISIGLSPEINFASGNRIDGKVAHLVGRSRGDQELPPSFQAVTKANSPVDVKVNYSSVQDGRYLKDGDILTIGEYEFVYRLSGSGKKTGGNI